MPDWWLTKDGDAACLALYEKHYSAYRYRDGRVRRLFCGPGDKLVLRDIDGTAFFVWRRFKDDCRDPRTGLPQTGINCAAFRNEGTARSSDLIRQADAIADLCWPDRRHYTYVDATRITSRNPGYCFQCAGWTKCGRTQGGLLIYERLDGGSGQASCHRHLVLRDNSAAAASGVVWPARSVVNIADRYCPMCNRRTAVGRAVVDPFVVVTCEACGHVHRVADASQVELASAQFQA